MTATEERREEATFKYSDTGSPEMVFTIWNLHGGKGRHVLLEQHEQADEHREREAVPEHVSQNSPLLSDPPRCGACNADALCIDHLAHDTARTIRCCEQDGIHTQSLRGDTL